MCVCRGVQFPPSLIPKDFCCYFTMTWTGCVVEGVGASGLVSAFIDNVDVGSFKFVLLLKGAFMKKVSF